MLKILGTGINISTGSVTGVVVVKNNTFNNNTIKATNGTISSWQSALVGIGYSRADVFDNRFESNSTGTIVGVDQWFGSPSGASSINVTGEIRFFGNLFNGNSIYGPLIHLFAAPNMRFVNNTVVNNLMYGHIDGPDADTQPDGLPQYDGYLMYGTPTSTAADISNSAGNAGRHVEIHNNLFYNNGIPSRGLMDNVKNLDISCLPINSGAPVRNNWFSPPIGVDNTTSTIAGECDALGKITGSIDEPLSASNFFGTAADPANPYRLRPTDPSITTLKSGINTGDNQALIDMFGDPAYKSQIDIRGEARVIIGGNPNPTYNGLVVDIGAYELGTPSAPVANSQTRSFAEDSTTSTVFTLTAAGGYTQVFTITSLPTEYDPTPTNACNGLPLLFTAPNIVTYCPPANFNTQYGPGNSNVPITIGFSVEDPIFKAGQISTNTISLTITAVNDGTPVAPDFNILSDYFTPINQQLTPAYQLSNFILTGTGAKCRLSVYLHLRFAEFHR